MPAPSLARDPFCGSEREADGCHAQAVRGDPGHERGRAEAQPVRARHGGARGGLRRRRALLGAPAVERAHDDGSVHVGAETTQGAHGYAVRGGRRGVGQAVRWGGAGLARGATRGATLRIAGQLQGAHVLDAAPVVRGADGPGGARHLSSARVCLGVVAGLRTRRVAPALHRPRDGAPHRGARRRSEQRA